MSSGDYNAVGITRPEIREATDTPHRPIEREDMEAALDGMPLRLESRIAQGFGSETWLVRTTSDFCSLGPDSALVAKLTVDAVEDSSEFFGMLPAASTPSILTPLHRRVLSENRILFISAHLPLGSLRQYMRGARLMHEDVRNIVRQITTALDCLGSMDSNRVLVHGDIKPENILVIARDPLQICLADFDHSRWVARESTRRHGGMLTRTYAAPEALSGLWSSNSDMWSLGIMLSELLFGSHPFDGLSDESVSALVSTSWEWPDVDSLNDEWRALLLGLLDRSYSARWRPADLTLWLLGDRDIIAKGLSRGREPSAVAPFEINGQPVYTARSLARALVGDWGNGIRAIHSPELGTWLRDALGSADLASRRQNLLDNNTLSDDDRLIRFAYFAHRELDPFWRNIRLSSSSLQQLAAQALDGDGHAFQQLVALRDAGIAESYSSLGIHGPEQLIGDWRAGWQRYLSGWQRLQEAGAPDARPADEAALPALIRFWLSEEERLGQTARVEQQSGAVRFLLRRDWYFALGHDLSTLPVEHQWILDSLDQSSLVETLTYSRSYRDLTDQEFRQPPSVTAEQLMNAVLFSETTERLTRNLSLRHGSREEITLQGEEQPDQQLNPDAWDSYWTRLTAPIGRRFERLAQRFRQWSARRRAPATAPNTPGGATPGTAQTAASISAVRLTLVLRDQSNVPMGQAVLFRWNLPPDARPVIHIGHLGLFGRRITRQRIVRLPFKLDGTPPPNALQRVTRQGATVGLPGRGQILFAFFQPTIVWLQYRMPRQRGAVRSQVLRLGARDIPFLATEHKLREAHATLLDAGLTELLPLTNMQEAVTASVPVDLRMLPVVISPSFVDLAPAERPVSFQHRRPELQLPVAAYFSLRKRLGRRRGGRIGPRSTGVF